MGEQTDQKLLVSIDGVNYAEMFPIVSVTPDLSDEICSQDKGREYYRLNAFEGCTIRFKPKRRFRCHSRKRFIKLLMAMNISRNNAQKIADCFRPCDSWMFRWFYFNFVVLG